MKLGVKIGLGVLSLIALIYGVCGGLLIAVSFNANIERERESALRVNRSIQYALLLVGTTGELGDFGDLAGVMRQLESGALWDGARLEMDGSALYSDGVEPVSMETDAGVCRVSTVPVGGGYYIETASCIVANGREVSLFILSDISFVYELRDTQLGMYRWLLLGALALGAAGSFLLSLVLTRSLRVLSGAARRIAGGDLSVRADVRSGDEVESLARDFNSMAAKLEENIEELQDSVRRQTEFMGSFAHELKTPMTSIIGYADLLRGQSLTPQEQQEAANYIFSEGRRLESLSLKLLDLLVLKKESVELVPSSPEALVTGVVRVLRPTLQKQGIDLRCRTNPGVCLMEPDLVKSLIINLIDNSRKAMDSGGLIFIVQSMTVCGCTITVTDNGRGIPRGELERITEAFYRVDKSRSRAQGGAGLGLALCSEIVRLHSGHLTFRSVEGRGTSVTAELGAGLPQKEGSAE